MDFKFWKKAFREAERELEAATGNITLKSAAKRYMRAKADVRWLEKAPST